MTIGNIALDQIEKVYSGAANTCMCGCAGNYTDPTSPGFKSRAGKVLKLLRSSTDTEAFNDRFDSGYSLVVDDRVHMVVLKRVP